MRTLEPATGGSSSPLTRTVVSIALVLMTLGSARAEADEPNRPDVVERYGWQMLFGDAASATAVLTTGWYIVPISLYAANGVMVHMFNGRGGRALGSGLLRLALPIGGLTIGFLATLEKEKGDCDRFLSVCDEAGLRAGAAIGMAIATTIDALFMSRETRPRRSSAVLRVGRIEANPSVAPSPNRGMMLGLTGSF